MKQARQFFGKKLALIASAIAVVVLTGITCLNYDYLKYQYYMLAVRQEIRVGDTGWGDAATDRLDVMYSKFQDQDIPTRYLLGENDPNLLAEGLLRSVKYDYPNHEAFVTKYSQDHRVVWYLCSISDICQDLNKILEAKKDGDITPEIEKLIDYWGV